MRKFKVSRKYQFHPNQMDNHDPEDAAQIEWNILLDPQHGARQNCIDSALWLNDVRRQRKKKEALSVWQFRGYNCYLPVTFWNPWRFPEVGPQWTDNTFPGKNETAHPDGKLESIEWFYGYLHACGISNESLHPHLTPYINYYATDNPWRGLPEMSYRPHSYYMQWHDENWQDRLVDYHVRFAQWADDKIDGPQALMLGSLKRHQVWPDDVKEARLYSETKTLPPPHGKVPMIRWMMDTRFNPAKAGRKSGSFGGNVPCFPETNMVGWWSGVCAIPGKLRYKLDRAGMKNWKVICDFNVGDNGWGGYDYMDRYITNESQRVEFIFSNAVKAAWGADIISWDNGSDEWFKQNRPWCLELKAAMAERAELIEEVSW